MSAEFAKYADAFAKASSYVGIAQALFERLITMMRRRSDRDVVELDKILEGLDASIADAEAILAAMPDDEPDSPTGAESG